MAGAHARSPSPKAMACWPWPGPVWTSRLPPALPSRTLLPEAVGGDSLGPAHSAPQARRCQPALLRPRPTPLLIMPLCVSLGSPSSVQPPRPLRSAGWDRRVQPNFLTARIDDALNLVNLKTTYSQNWFLF